jgi:catechol 2,3-dioxygenase-like lactoylglutathione lyase family enzyme
MSEESACCGPAASTGQSQQSTAPAAAKESSAAAGTCCEPATGIGEVQDLPSGVRFATERRPHINLNVRDLRESILFYRALFGQRPTKLRDDYAKWETEFPPVNLSILQNPTDQKAHGHFGIEVKSTDAVHEYYERLRRLRVPVDATEQNVACCFSVQTKIWAADPDGNRWEIFVVTENEAEEGCGATCICYNPDTGGCEWKS